MKILFLTGTRADYGKLKSLIKAVSEEFDYEIFATGMHTLKKYGLTVNHIHKDGYRIHEYLNQSYGDPMDIILADTVMGLSKYVRENEPEMIIVHGDRVEALAGAIVGSLNNIRVAHIEGGELSGTIDGVIRHAISKLSHLHFVANDKAALRLKQMGEENIHVVGSPDIDLMLSDLPSLEEAKERYQIPFKDYGIVLLHSVTTEPTGDMAEILVEGLKHSNKHYIVIYPNNDPGSEEIVKAYAELKDDYYFRKFPSLRFEHFLTLLKNARFIIGNSSAGIREAPIYGVYSINIGSRQDSRSDCDSIINIPCNLSAIVHSIREVETLPPLEPNYEFGDGKSTEKIMKVLRDPETWQIPLQKRFIDLKGDSLNV